MTIADTQRLDRALDAIRADLRAAHGFAMEAHDLASHPTEPDATRDRVRALLPKLLQRAESAIAAARALSDRIEEDAG